MEGEGLPLLNCLWHHLLRSLCSWDSCNQPSKWVYAVLWRVLPRNYPPPQWDDGRVCLDRSNRHQRNWILVWEDGFCDFGRCERSFGGLVRGRFGSDVFFKMSHEVYSYGEGLIGKVAADNSHRWVFREVMSESDTNCSSWSGSLDVKPKAWESQFSSGIQTIAVVAVREGVIQLGSFDKVSEDLNLVIDIQRKFNYLQSIPGLFVMERPNHSPLNHRYKSIDFGQKTTLPALMPPMSYSLGALLSKLPSVIPPRNNDQSHDLKFDSSESTESKPKIEGMFSDQYSEDMAIPPK
ncbi:hypothetical protein QJS10_CPA05g01310 [Acorus calamus]|uniref:Transcription factor MYC/MYB N-terminal domain-containing protein n=1 Tax=Acorus calamus TaxID=4465 RepID=A0AAV9ES95_ACOCL|nr:hypothetical protein QJS10_CPA05g01310 [Acorus calamus]